MKAKLFLSIILLATIFFSCDSHTYQELEEDPVVVERVTYNANIKSIMDNNCISCHAADRVVSWAPLTTYAEVKDAVLNKGLLQRIQLENGDPSLMPRSGRLPQGQIDLIVKWSNEELLEN